MVTQFITQSRHSLIIRNRVSKVPQMPFYSGFKSHIPRESVGLYHAFLLSLTYSQPLSAYRASVLESVWHHLFPISRKGFSPSDILSFLPLSHNLLAPFINFHKVNTYKPLPSPAPPPNAKCIGLLCFQNGGPSFSYIQKICCCWSCDDWLLQQRRLRWLQSIYKINNSL